LTFKVAEDVLVDGKVVIRTDSVVKAVVTAAKKPGFAGISGKLSIRIDSAKATDGQDIKLRAAKSGKGGNNTGTTVGLVVLFGPIGLLKHGKDAVIPAGTILSAFTDEAKSVTPLDPERAEVYVVTAAEQYKQGKLDLAIASYTKAIEKDPKYTDAYIGRGNIHSEKGSLAPAIADYGMAIQLSPRNSVPLYNRGVIYMRKGQNDLAMADYSEAILLDPKYALAFYNRGIIFVNQGIYDKAISVFTSLLEIVPQSTDGFYARSRAYCLSGQKSLASADEKKVVKLGGVVKTKCDFNK